MAVSLGGSDGYIEVPNSADIDVLQGFSITFYVKFDTKPGAFNPVMFGPNDWYINRDSSNNIQFNVTVGGTGYIAEAPSTTYSTNTWINLTVRYTGSKATISIDGTEEGSNSNMSGNVDDLTRPLRIGTNASLSAFTPMDVDETYFYAKELSSLTANGIRARNV